ncbi:MAG TPA: maleylpyruvate isomerase N-terminal domain-containing protein [Longimicrobiales bacterium]|nr:maleylpyruvate isomerase N-terminal domain-containing protein [Longimicrobiales bacterium]
MQPLTPVYTAPLFPPLHRALVVLLRGIDAAAWQRPTVAGRWRVRDVAAHLLDGDLRRLAATRDGHALAPERPLHSFADVVGFINELNATGVRYGERLSPRLLVEPPRRAPRAPPRRAHPHRAGGWTRSGSRTGTASRSRGPFAPG